MSPGDIIYSIVTTVNNITVVNNTILPVWKLLRDLKNSHYKKKTFVAIYGDKCQLDFLWQSFPNIHKYWIIMLYTQN